MWTDRSAVTDGVNWFRPGASRRIRPAVSGRSTAGWRALFTCLAVVAMLGVTVAPASAKPAKDSGGSVSTYQSCSDVLADSATTSLSDIRVAIGADQLLNTYGLSGGGIGVAVIDTGVNEVVGLTGRQKVVDGPDLSFDALEDNLRNRDLHGHGTNMAAIIAANNTESGDGLAPDSHIINVKVGAGDGSVDVSQVIAGIDWVVANRDINGENIRVINLAFDTDATQDYLLDPLSHAVENAWNAGIVVVVAGGNDGRGISGLGNPAINPFVIAVGAAHSSVNGVWKVPSWSSTGDGVRNPDLVAPGDSILSAGVAGSYLAHSYPAAVCENDSGDLAIRGSGTSQAAAAVAGAAALLLEQRPWLTPDQVKYLLTSTAADLGAQTAFQGAGMINLAAAASAPTPGSEAIQTHQPSTGTGSLEAARGSFHVGTEGDYLEGEVTAFGEIWTLHPGLQHLTTSQHGLTRPIPRAETSGPAAPGPAALGPAPHGPAPHGPAPHGPAPPGPAPPGPAPPGPAPPGPAPPGPAPPGPAPPGPAPHGHNQLDNRCTGPARARTSQIATLPTSRSSGIKGPQRDAIPFAE